MNQKSSTIVFKTFMGGKNEGWGHEEGHAVYTALLKFIKSDSADVYRVSMKGIDRTDVSFPRESLVSIAKHFRKSKGFYLTDMMSESLIENWDAASEKLEQPFFLWDESKFKIIGCQPPKGTMPIIEYLASVPSATTGDVAKAIKLNVPNMSNKLKKLWEGGFIMRNERVAESGGIEFEYSRIN